jgi:L-seryl-tRNA(Ser) seleniumtransferase
MVRAVLGSTERRVINATGVLLHTNLGRAPWSENAWSRAGEIALGYSNLELDLDTGGRGRRGGYVTALLRSLTEAEDAMVVNNNAAAVLLSLAALASGRAVPVARGELIEIGGAYRLPEVMAASGALLVEVGTTNRTRLGDYQTALQLHRCAAILKVHPSNYRVEGFTEEVGIEALAQLAAKHQVPLIHDIGSGLLDADLPWLQGDRPRWLAEEPAARQSLQSGAGLVLFSGDKLLGGPQAGVIVGNASLVGHLRSHPLARALRPDAVTLAALAATLEAYAGGPLDEIPFWRMALTPYRDLEQRAAYLAERLDGRVTEGHSAVGGGSAPGALIPSPLVTLDGQDHLYEALLGAEPPVLARREEGALIIDLRCVDQAADETIVSTVLKCR